MKLRFRRAQPESNTDIINDTDGLSFTRLLVGVAGLPNWGDEFIALSWVRSLQRRFPNDQIRFESPTSGNLGALMAAQGAQVLATDALWRTARQAFDNVSQKAKELGIAAEHMTKYVQQLGTPYVDIALEQLREARSVHIVGGGFLNSIGPANNLVATGVAALPDAICKVATGQGLVPASETTADILRPALCSFDHVSVRDAPSATALGCTLQQGVDDAFLGLHPSLVGSTLRMRDEPTPDYMLLIQGDMFEQGAESRAQIVETLQEELARAGWRSGDEVGAVEGIPGNDVWIKDALQNAGISNVKFYPFETVWLDGLPMRRGQYWISTRYHFHLVAAALGIAGTAIVVSDDYYATKHGALIEAGTGWRLVDSSGVVLNKTGDVEEFPRRALRLSQHKWDEACKIYPFSE